MSEEIILSQKELQELLSSYSEVLKLYFRSTPKKNVAAGMSVQSNDTGSDMDKAMKVCEKAEKLLNEGKLREASEKYKECEKLIGRAGLGY
jgi:hypothetical protein